MSVQKLLWYKEVATNVVPSPVAVGYALKAEDFGIQSTQQTEENQLLGAGRGSSPMGYGADDIAGSLPMIFGVDNILLLLTHAIGDSTATTNASDVGAGAVAWTMATVTAVGDIVDHSDGLHSLVCYSVSGTGTTGATEPDLSAYTTSELGRNVKIIDNAGLNQVTWIIMPVMYTHVGERGDCLSSFAMEVTDSEVCEGGSNSFSRYTGLYINSMTLSLNGDTKTIKVTLDAVGMKKQDSLLDSDWAPLVVTLEKVLEDDFFSFDGCILKINGVTASKFTSFDLTIANGVEMTNGFNGDKINDVGLASVSGTISAQFNEDFYKDASSHAVQTAEIIVTKINGGGFTINLPQYEMEKTDKMFAVGKKTMLDGVAFKGFDTAVLKSINYVAQTTIATY